jgi:hypothetical protein
MKKKKKEIMHLILLINYIFNYKIYKIKLFFKNIKQSNS